MSHFTTVRTQYKNKKLLLKSLKQMGYQPVSHSQPVRLQTMWSSRAVAHIVIPREQTHSGAEIGFLHQDDGYQLVADNMYWHGNLADFRQQLSKNYAILEAKRNGFSVVEEKSENGQVQLVLQGV
ncbi:MAG: DUF1257 domain-containing protein [Microcystaceae cyanobacterium]